MEITHANAGSNFANAAKGNAFGIFTMYTLQTHDIGEVWGGTITYEQSHLAEFAAAITDFVANNQEPRSCRPKLHLGPRKPYQLPEGRFVL